MSSGRALGVAAADLGVEGNIGSFAGAVEWINSQPLTPSSLRGKVVVVQFWTYTCINWLRTQAYFRAWSRRYRDDGLVALGVHTPEFKFEHDRDNVRWAVKARNIDYPVAVDSNFDVWRAFANHYWPAYYFVDAEGRIRHHRFGEGDFERSEMVIRQLLADAGAHDLAHGLAAVEFNSDEVQADWENLGSPESYLGYEQQAGFEPGPGGARFDEIHAYEAPAQLRLNHWGLTGDWKIRSDASALHGSRGSLAFQFHARDANLVMGPANRGQKVRFRTSVDGQAAGEGAVVEQRMYQLVRQTGPIRDRRFEIEFLEPGAEVFCFTFG